MKARMKVITVLVCLSLLYSSCVCAVPAADTIAARSPLSQPQDKFIYKLLGLVGVMESADRGSLVQGLRGLLSDYLSDEPEGLSVFFNINIGEAFVFTKKGIVQIYRDKNTEIPAEPIKAYNSELVNIKIYPYTEEVIRILKENKGLTMVLGLAEVDLSAQEYTDIVKRRVIEILKAEEVYEEGIGIRELIRRMKESGVKHYLNALMDVAERLGALEADNAIKMRDFVFANGVNLNLNQSFISEYPWLRFRVIETDADLNFIIARNIEQVLANLEDEEREDLLSGLRRFGYKDGIAIAILDKLPHNCGGFIGVNRYLLEKIKDALIALAEELKGEKSENVISELEAKIKALEIYLQTYLYHKLRHEAFIEERNLLTEMMYEDSGLGRVFSVEDLDKDELARAIDSLEAGIRKRFDNEIERRQIGRDAGYFIGISIGDCERFLNYLMEFKILDMDSLFLHASIIAGFALETKGKHYNELIIEDFSGLDKNRLARVIYERYEKEYEERYRNKISHLLYKVGLNNHIRAEIWRKTPESQKEYDRELAKRYIVRLIDFVSEYERYLTYVPGRGKVSMFRRRDNPLSPKEAVQLLTVTLLSNGDYSQAILRTELAFKTGGIVNTVTTNRSEFWKLVEEACAERAGKGDNGFRGITFEMMKKASIERELLPRLRIIYPFKRYLSMLPGTQFQKQYKESLDTLCRKYRTYREGGKVLFDDDDVEKFEKLYKKVQNILSETFGVDYNEDLLVILWNTFDFMDNLFPCSDYPFTEPFLNEINPDEVEDIINLQNIFYKDLEDIAPGDIISKETKRRVQIVLRIYKNKIQRRRECLNNILNRYGSSRDIEGNRVWDLMRQTRGWAGAVWIAREYSDMFKRGLISRALELDSGLSVFYRALLSVKDVETEDPRGVMEVISDPTAEIFGENPNRFSGDITEDALVDMRDGEPVTMEEELYQLIVSLYNLQTINSPQKMYSIFREVNRLLEYGGHFVIILPPGRMYGEESLRALREKMGFETVVKPGVTWNELSEEAKAKIGREEAERESRELIKKKFYIVILEKVGKVKEGEEELQDKSLLIPSVITEKELGKTLEPVNVPPEEDNGTSPAEGAVPFVPAEVGLVSSGVVDGMYVTQGAIAGRLREGLGESDRLKERAENVGTISGWQKLIMELLNSDINVSEKLKIYIKGELNGRITQALAYNDSDYTSDIEKELFNLYEKLEELKKFIANNFIEFQIKLEAIRKKVNFAERLSGEDRGILRKVLEFTNTDLSEETLRIVRDMCEKLVAIEKSQKYIDENWAEFDALQKMIRKYGVFATSWMGKDLQDVLGAERKDLSPDLMSKAKRLDSAIAKRFSGKMKIGSIKEIEVQIEKLKKWKNCEFLFTLNDIEFLERFLREWSESALDVNHLQACMRIVDDWEVLRAGINWDSGLAVLLKSVSENVYMRTLYRELLFKPFISGKGISEEDVDFILPRDVQRPGRKSGYESADRMEPYTKGAVPSPHRGVEKGTTGVNPWGSIEIPENYCITSDFLSDLEEQGLKVMNIYKIWLALGANVEITPDKVRSEVERCMRCEKTLVVVKKKGPAVSVVPDLSKLKPAQIKDQDYSNWLESREIILQSLTPSNFLVCSLELLSKSQILRMYPDWAGEFLGKEDWVGDFFESDKVKVAVGVYNNEKERQRKRREDDERARREREANIIRMSKEPKVKITYGGIWTESITRDLAQILLAIISDFDKPPDLDVIVKNELIITHPQLSKIPEGELKIKIEELVRFRWYDLRIGRFYKELARILGLVMIIPESRTNTGLQKEIDGIKKVVPLSNLCKIGRLLLWHEYQLGVDSSPFGKDAEELYNEVLGNLLLLKRYAAEESDTGFPIQERRLVVHFLSDPGGILRQFSGKVSGLDVSAEGKSIGVENSLLGRAIETQSRSTTEVARNMKKVQGIYAQAENVFTLLSEIYKDKSLDIGYFEGLLNLLDCLYNNININDFDLNEVTNVLEIIIENLGKLFGEKMTASEFAEFVEKMKQRLKTERKSLSIDSTEEAGLSAFHYYMYGGGQGKTIKVNKEDAIMSKLAEGEVRIGNYFEILRLIKPVKLYQLSEEEREVLDKLAEDLVSASDEDTEIGIIAQIITYMKISNTINRYLYFMNKYISRIWAQDSLEHAHDLLETVAEKIIEVEPNAAVFTSKAGEFNIVVLLTELYRLKQMAEDDSLTEDIKLELQHYLIELIIGILKMILGLNQAPDLHKLRKGETTIAELRSELSAIGNRYHIDLITNILIGVPHLRQADEFALRMNIEMAIDKNDKERIRHIIEELKLLFIYFQKEKQVALRNVANIVVLYSTTPIVRHFLQLFERHIPEEIEMLRELMRGMAPKPVPSAKQQSISILRALNENIVPQELIEKIKSDQGTRCLVLSIINNIFESSPELLLKNSLAFITLLSNATMYMQNPYEIYCAVKNLTTSPAEEAVAFQPDMIPFLITRLIGFLDTDESRRQVIDILTRTYNQYFTMKDFIKYGMHGKEELRTFIADLFIKGDYNASAYAYHYIRDYIASQQEGKAEKIHEILLRIINGLLEDVDNLNNARFKRALALCAVAVHEEPGIRIKQEWESIIEKYKQGKISKKTLLEIMRNAEWMIDDVCSELTDTRIINDRKSRFGLTDKSGENIFKKAIREKEGEGTAPAGKEEGDAYFGGMAQAEINPQIKRLLNPVKGESDFNRMGRLNKFVFIQGQTDEGETGRLKLSREQEMLLKEVLSGMGKLRGYGIVVLKEVNFSGHYSKRHRGRIYIPLEILEAFSGEDVKISERKDLLLDFIEHEYLHTIGCTEKSIIAKSKRERPGVYEKARELYVKYVAGKLQEVVRELSGLEITTDNIEQIIKDVQEGKRIELTETQFRRLLWLIERSRGLNLVPQIAELVNLILGPDYTGDPGIVIMAIEKAILSDLYTGEQLASTIEDESGKILVQKTIGGLRFSGPKIPKNVKNTLQYMNRFKVTQPAKTSESHYVLIDEYRAGLYKEIIEQVSAESGVIFITELPEKVDKRDVVVLVDPEDADRYKGYSWYLPLTYSKKSFILAASLSINKPDNIKGTEIFRYVKGFYKELLAGQELSDEEIISWFEEPRRLKSRIRKLSEELKLLRIAVRQLDTSA